MISASSSGTIMMQDPDDAWRFLEQLSNGSKVNFSTRKPVSTAAAVGADADWKKEVKKEIGELNRKFDRLMSTLQNGLQNQQQGGQQGQRTQEVHQVHGQGKKHVNAIDIEWRKLTEEDLVEKEGESKNEKSKEKSDESDQVKEDKGVQKDEQPVVAGIKKKKDKKVNKKQDMPSKPNGPSINQPLWDELKNAPEDTKILQEMCEKNGIFKTPTPGMVRLTVKASEALLGTLPKKERDPGSPLITVTVWDVIIRNTLLDLGASVNVLPGYLYDKYKNEELEPAKMVLQLADQSTKVSRGKLTNVIVKVGDFFYPVDFLVMEYESLEDAPVLILGRPFLAIAGAVMDCKTGDMDIFFGTWKRRLNMFGCLISLPPGYNDKYLNNSPFMAPKEKDNGRNQGQGNGSDGEEIL
ncbi:hypothetical protein L2E82_45458 [Cichorium intybus]|uniref:Uncharacterized protein n=1 Tax=Cichorium intybus TaxID=13427 RepID=A0ACB8ZT26_CICIN|nr:hypothetical protein L2E82_45458 [Cichorium intybus]